MKTSNGIRMGRSAFLALGFFLVILLSVGTVQADLTATATVVASEGVYIDPGQADTNTDGGLLFVSGNGAGGASQITLLKFDLSSVAFSIEDARLNLAVINDPGTCFIASDAVSEISLYAVDSAAWDEATVTYNSGPARGSLLDDLDENPLNPAAHAHFTDNGGSLAGYLEAERATGDGVAAVWLETTDGALQAIFDDNEGTGASSGCAGADLLPTLQLADSGSPLAVNVTTFAAQHGGQPLSMALIASVIFIIGTAFFVGARRTRPARD